MTLGGLTVLVTGAGGGVGRGIALASAAAGAHVLSGPVGTMARSSRARSEQGVTRQPGSGAT